MSQNENRYYETIPMEKRVYFNIPFSQKEDAKSFHMRWDTNLKLWYAIDNGDLEACLNYFDKPYHKPFRYVKCEVQRDW